MNTAPTVSVILPTFNRAATLDRSIESVLRQTYDDFELVVVDDGSTDDTGDVVDRFDDGRIRYLEHDENRGASAARNTGIAEARGEYVAFQDSDDEWHPEKLAKQMAAFRQAPDTVGVVYTGCWRTENGVEKYLPYDGVESTEGDVQRSLVRRNFIPTPVAVVRRDCFERVGGFDERAPPLDDWELWLRISDRFEFRLVDEPLVTGRVRTDSISRDRRALVDARKRIVEKHRDKFDRDSLATHLFYIGHGAMKVGETGRGRKYLAKASKTEPHPLYVGALFVATLGAGAYRSTYRFTKRYPRLFGGE